MERLFLIKHTFVYTCIRFLSKAPIYLHVPSMDMAITTDSKTYLLTGFPQVPVISHLIRPKYLVRVEFEKYSNWYFHLQ